MWEMNFKSILQDKIYKYLEEIAGKIPDTVEDSLDIKKLFVIFNCN